MWAAGAPINDLMKNRQFMCSILHGVSQLPLVGWVHNMHSCHVLHGTHSMSCAALIMCGGAMKRSPMVASIGTLAIRGWIRRSHASLRSHISPCEALLAPCMVNRLGSLLLMREKLSVEKTGSSYAGCRGLSRLRWGPTTQAGRSWRWCPRSHCTARQRCPGRCRSPSTGRWGSGHLHSHAGPAFSTPCASACLAVTS